MPQWAFKVLEPETKINAIEIVLCKSTFCVEYFRNLNIQRKLDILFSSNHNIHKSLCGLCFWPSDPLIGKFYYNLSIKGTEAQKQRPIEHI